MHRPPKLLWLARAIPLPLDAGDRIYTARFAQAVADIGADVHFLGLADSDRPLASVQDALGAAVKWEAIRSPLEPPWRAVAHTLPLVSVRHATRAYLDRISNLVRAAQYDAIILDQYAMGFALPVISRESSKRPAIVHIAHDFETEVTRDIARNYRDNLLVKLALHENARRTAALERRLTLDSDLIVAISDADAARFRALKPGREIMVARPGFSAPVLRERVIDARVPRRAVILGSYRWLAKQMNLSQFLEIADPIFAEANIGVDIIGDISPEFQREWAPRLRASHFHGFVEDVQKLMQSARVALVVEATGGGFKLKVLDYVFSRLPVAALTSSVAGQEEVVAKHFHRADTIEELAAGVVRLVDDLEALNTMQNGAFAAAENRYSWPENAKALLARIASARPDEIGPGT